MEIGAQLYTVREHTKTLEDFSRTLEKIAAIGYRNVQVSGTCAYDPAWLKAELDRTGLRCVLTHTDPGRIAAETDTVAAAGGPGLPADVSQSQHGIRPHRRGAGDLSGALSPRFHAR